MSDKAAQLHEDADYFGLVGWERVVYFGRCAQLWGRRAAYHGERAERYARIAGRWIVVSVVLWAVAVALVLIGGIR